MHRHTRRLAAAVSELVLSCAIAGARGEEPALKALVPKGLLIGVAVN